MTADEDYSAKAQEHHLNACLDNHDEEGCAAISLASRLITALTPPIPEAGLYLSWSDDGVTLICEREECMVPGPCRDTTCITPLCDKGRWWWQETIPGRPTPEDAAAFRDAHIATHTP